jgi:hypothetical protein
MLAAQLCTKGLMFPSLSLWLVYIFPKRFGELNSIMYRLRSLGNEPNQKTHPKMQNYLNFHQK